MTLSRCPIKVSTKSPLSVFQILIVLSTDPEASWLLSILFHATEITASLCPTKVLTHLPLFVSQILIVESSDPDASRERSSFSATEYTFGVLSVKSCINLTRYLITDSFRISYWFFVIILLISIFIRFVRIILITFLSTYIIGLIGLSTKTSKNIVLWFSVNPISNISFLDSSPSCKIYSKNLYFTKRQNRWSIFEISIKFIRKFLKGFIFVLISLFRGSSIFLK